MKMKTLILTGATLCAAAFTSQAETIVVYDINETDGLSASTLATDVTATDLSSPDWNLVDNINIADGGFFNIPESAGMEDGSDADMTAAFTSGQFLEFSISTTSFESFELAELQMTLGRGYQGPTDYAVRISTDGFAAGYGDTGLASYAVTSLSSLDEATTFETISLAGLTLDSSTTLTFRIAMDNRTNDSASNSAGRFYDIAITTVPEPSAAALLMGLGSLAFLSVRRRR